MRTAIITVFICLIGFTNCKKDSAYKHSGTIVAYDYSTCPCCGGYLVKIDGSNASYRAKSFPSGSIVDSTHFPIKINLNYMTGDTCGTIQFITITSMIIVY